MSTTAESHNGIGAMPMEDQQAKRTGPYKNTQIETVARHKKLRLSCSPLSLFFLHSAGAPARPPAPVHRLPQFLYLAAKVCALMRNLFGPIFSVFPWLIPTVLLPPTPLFFFGSAQNPPIFHPHRAQHVFIYLHTRVAPQTQTPAQITESYHLTRAFTHPTNLQSFAPTCPA